MCLKFFRLNETQHKALSTSIVSFVVNILFAIIKGLAGIFGNSYALIADAIESLTDVFASLLVVLGIRYSSRPADENHPYGHGKAEPLITFAVVGFLLISATIIFYQSIINIRTPHETPETYTLYILLAIIVAKETLFRFIQKKGEETHSTSLKADAWHHRSDAISSAVAVIGISVALIFGKGYESADDWAALLTSVFILGNAYLIFRPALGEIMDEHTYLGLEEKIRTEAKRTNGVWDTEKLYIRKHGMLYYVDMHLIVNGTLSVSEGHRIAHDVKDHVMQTFPEIGNVLIHVEPNSF